MSLERIETIKTSISITQNTPKTQKIYVKVSNVFKHFEHSYFSKLKFKLISGLSLICIAFFIFFVEGHTA